MKTLRFAPALLALTLAASAHAASTSSGEGSWSNPSSGGSSGAWSNPSGGGGDMMATAMSHVEAGNYPAAAANLRAIVSVQPTNADAYNMLGYSLRKSGDYFAAEPAYAEALRLNPNHLGALEYQGELFIALGRMDEARINLARLQALCPSGCDERAQLETALLNAQ